MIQTSTRVNLQLEKSIPAAAEAVALFLPENLAIPPKALDLLSTAEGNAVQRLLFARIPRGKAGEITHQLVELARGMRRVLFIGVGNPAKLGPEQYRQAAGALARYARKQRFAHIALIAPEQPAEVEAVVNGFLLASFQFDQYKGTASRNADDDKAQPLRLSVVALGRGMGEAIARATTYADAQNFARTLASRPGNDINPPRLAEIAHEVAGKSHLSARILNEKQLEKLGMQGILGVGQGSETPPRLIALEHKPRAAKGRPVLLVGKGITFDSGGISIKPADKMGRMVYDKSGACIVLATMWAVAQLKLPIHVVGILSCAENKPGGRSYRPGDLLKLYNGVTVDVVNTDAEGRLVLADALAWGIETYKPAAVVDLATLTGGCVIALGRSIAGLMSNDDFLARQLTESADAAGEKVWRLPVGEDQREQMKSDIADIVNSAGRDASPLQGAAFLSYFVPEGTPWAHLDIAGTADTEKELPYYAKGATAWGVRTLLTWLTRRATAF